MNQIINILLVEDNRADIRLIEEYLLDVPNQEFEIFSATKLTEGLKLLESQDFDVILLDLSLPDSRGKNSIEQISEKAPHIPLVILTGLDDEQVSIDAIRLGAQDYLVKNNVSSNLLSRTIRHAIERKQTEQELSESQRVYETLVGNLPGMSYRCMNDQDWTMLFVSSGCYDLLGYDPETLTGPNQIAFAEIMHPEDREYVWNSIQEKINEKTKYQIEYRVISKSGETKWVWEQGEPIFSKNGKLLFLEGFISNITERKRAENELENSKNFFEQLYLQSAISTQLIDPDGWCIRINPKFSELFGITQEEIEGKVYNIFQDQQFINAGLDQKIKLVFEEKETISEQIEYTIPNQLTTSRSNAHKHWLNIISYPILDSNNRLEYIIIQHNDITVQKAAEEALRHSEERFRSLYENVLTGLYRTTPSGQIVMANPALVNMLGYDNFEELVKLNKNPIKRMSSPDREIFIELMQNNGEVHGFESIWIKKDGSPIHIRESAIAIHDQNGEIIFFEGTLEDITESKLAEEELRKQQSNVTAIIENTRNRIWSIDKKYRLIVANSEFYKRNREDRNKAYFPGDNLLDNNLEPEIAGKWKYYYDRALSGEQFSIESSEEYGDNKKFYEFSFNPIIQPNREVEGVSIVGRDITERVKAHQQVERQIRDLEAVYQIGLKISSSLNIKEIGEHLVTTFSNQLSWKHVIISLKDDHEDKFNIIAFSKENLTKEEEKHLKANYSPKIKNTSQGMIEKAILKGTPTRIDNFENFPEIIQITPHAKSGMFMPLKIGARIIGIVSIESEELNAFTLEDERLLATLSTQAAIAFENARLFQKTQTEIADRKQIEKELEIERSQLANRVKARTAELLMANEELARANKLKDEFLSTMSHELRTPLNAILSLSESLIEGVYGEINHDQNSTVKIINESGRDLLELINDILDLSKMEAGKTNLDIIISDVNEICKSALRITKQQATKKHLEVTYTLDRSIESIQVDGRRLKQILVNLLTNAIKFTPENGNIGLDVSSENNKESIRFTIWDTGIGITEEQIPHLFKPFIQLDSALNRKHAGTGLGLALVKKLTEMHGGEIGVTSEIGKGSQFSVILPVKNELFDLQMTQDSFNGNSLQYQTATPDTSSDPTARKILIAEDNHTNFIAVRDYLQILGYQIHRATNGNQAVEMAEEIHPDLILMDIQMPELDGLEATKKIRSNPANDDIFIYALTALAMPGDKDRCLKAGANDYISKPFSLKKLAEQINLAIPDKG